MLRDKNQGVESLQNEQFRKLQKIKLIDSSENFGFQYNDSNDLNLTEDEINDQQESLFGDDQQEQSQAINFFSQAITLVTPEILERILSLKDFSDDELIDSVVDFITNAIKSKEISQELLANNEIADYLLSILDNTQDSGLQKRTIIAVLLFSKRLEDLMSYFFDQGVFAKCCQIIDQCIKNNTLDIDLISLCFKYINLIFLHSDNNQCDELCDIIAPIYHSLIQLTQSSIDSSEVSNEALRIYKPLAELNLNSIHFLIMQCSDQGLSKFFDESFADFIIFMQNTFPESFRTIIKLLAAISYHDPSYSIPLLPLLTDQIQSLSDLQKLDKENDPLQRKKDLNELPILILLVLQNFAIDDDQSINEFLFSEPVLEFLQSCFDEKPYPIIKDAAFVYSFLSSSNNDGLLQFLWENGQDAILTMIDSLDINDSDFVIWSFQCILNLLTYLENTNTDSFSECLQFITNTDIEDIISEAITSSKSEELIQIATNLNDMLDNE